MSVRVDTQHLSGFVGENEYKALAPQVKLAHEMLHNGTGLGNDFIGWVDLPTNYDKEEFARIKEAAKRIQANSQVFIVIGIGGSYLGARAAIEFLKSPNYNNMKKDTPDIYFTGNAQLHCIERAAGDLRGQGRLHQHDLQVRHDDGAPQLRSASCASSWRRSTARKEARKRIYCTTE